MVSECALSWGGGLFRCDALDEMGWDRNGI